ncbi:MAG: tRNA preQ1(34) S-adenosylmethionine ribosyltransferase-isomerase QueA [Myxococcota bacterium]
MSELRAADLDYVLPRERIALRPLEARDASRLLVVAERVMHHTFRELPELLPEGCLVVVNDSRVVPARIFGTRVPGGGRVELVCVRPVGDVWLCLGQASKPLRPGSLLDFHGMRAAIVARRDDELLEVRFDGDITALLARAGRVPLPPYLGRDDNEDDRARYQTVYAQAPGSVAAPTAGLHFTPELLARLRARTEVASVTLHVGPGTFLPPRGDDPSEWRVPPEPYAIPDATAAAIESARARRRTIVAVGTTAVRTLETFARTGRSAGETDLVLRPGDAFRLVGGLVSNFHLPRSTLLALVCALGGRARVLGAYKEAIAAGYRFLSYGDATLIWPAR